jgi:hypothetical protein
MDVAVQPDGPSELFRLQKLLFSTAIQASAIILDFAVTLHPALPSKGAVEPNPSIETDTV